MKNAVTGLSLGFLVLCGIACGIKAPPVPRDEVVPAPIQKVSITQVEKGVRIEFELPDGSIGGTPLSRIGGYRIVRFVPGEKPWKEDTYFGVTQQLAMPGKTVSLEEIMPETPGTYRYEVYPLDPYRSHPRYAAGASFSWNGSAITGPVTEIAAGGVTRDEESGEAGKEQGKERE